MYKQRENREKELVRLEDRLIEKRDKGTLYLPHGAGLLSQETFSIPMYTASP